VAAGALREGGLRPKRRSRSNDATASPCAQDGASSGEGDGPARGWIRKGLPLVHQDQQRRSAPRLEQYTPPCHPPVVARGNSDDRAARPSSHIFGVTPPAFATLRGVGIEAVTKVSLFPRALWISWGSYSSLSTNLRPDQDD
jgi:hypothetical protein